MTRTTLDEDGLATLRAALRVLGPRGADALAKRADVCATTVARAGTGAPLHRATVRAILSACADVLGEVKHAA